jgi:hypothetical protein
MLLLVGGMSFVSWHGYRHEPWERKTALKLNAVVGAWFFYLLWVGPPAFVDGSYVEGGLAILAFALAVNARRLMHGAELLFVRHWAENAITNALQEGQPIGAEVPVRLKDPSGTFPVAGLRTFFHRRRAAQARALRDKVNADAELAEAIVRRERARAEAEILRARRRAKPDEWRRGQTLRRHRPERDRQNYPEAAE